MNVLLFILALFVFMVAVGLSTWLIPRGTIAALFAVGCMWWGGAHVSLDFYLLCTFLAHQALLFVNCMVRTDPNRGMPYIMEA